MEVTLNAEQAMEKIVKPSGNSGRVYAPKAWIGKRVKILLLEDVSKEKEKQI